MSELPTLYGTLSLHRGVLGWRGWCQRCKMYHFHGWNSSSPEPQHRVGHCRNAGSPDYMIALSGNQDELLERWAKLQARDAG
jgi:hypothetical protein